VSRKSNGYGKLTTIETKMVLSPAFISLGKPGSCDHVSSVSTQLPLMLLLKRQYTYMRRKKGSHKEYVRSDDNKITLTYKELLSYGKRINKKGEWVTGIMTQPQITRGFDELLAKGFIGIARYGGAYDRDKQEYSLEGD